MNIQKKKLFITTGLILLSSLVLLWSAINNGYPLIHSDTGAYVGSSFDFKLLLSDRPLGYGLFLLSARLFNSLWFPVLLQSLITAFLLFRVTSVILPDIKEREFIAFGSIIISVLTTDVSKYVSWIMPDIFTAWLFLAGLLFFITTKFIDKISSAIIIFFSFMVHNSHVYLVYFSVVLLLIFSRKFRLRNSYFRKDLKGFLLVVLIATLGLGSLNLILNNGFKLTYNNSVYYINKLAYHGFLTKTLEKFCDEKDWKLCSYREVLESKVGHRNWFLWGDDSPIWEINGWENNSENQDEYYDIISHSLKSFFPMIILSSLEEAKKQLTTYVTTTELKKYDKDYAVVGILNKNYPADYIQFMNGKQQTGQNVRARIFPLDEDFSLIFFITAATIVFGFCLFFKHNFLVLIFVSFLIFVLLNAILIGFTITAEGHYQGKIYWLLPYFTFLMVLVLFLKHHIGISNLIKIKFQRFIQYND